MNIKLTLLASTPQGLVELSRQLPVPEESVAVSSVIGGVRELSGEIERSRPDLVVADMPKLDESDLRRIEGSLAASPATSMIILSPDRTPEYQLEAMRAGVREVVPTPLANGELKVAFGRQLGRLQALRGGARQGRVLAFVPAKGGSGSTFISTNLAYALAARGRRVALIDLNLHFGDAALFLSEARPAQTIADVAREASRLDGSFLEASMLAAAPSLWVLAAPDSPEAAIDVRPEAVERIVSLARSRFDFVVLDMGRILDASTVRALDQAETIYITVQQTLPFLHDAKRLMGMLASLGYARDKLHLIVNRWEKGTEISSDDVRQALGLAVDLEVPNSFRAVAHSINHGIPILKSAARDPVARTLLDMAERLAPAQVERKRGWFGR